MKKLRFIASVLVMLSALDVAAQAPSEDASRTAARVLGEHGVEAYWAKDYVAASNHLEKAYRLFATPTLGLYSARALANLGQLVEAAERYRETARMSVAVGDIAAQQRAQEDAATELAELQPRIPVLTVELNVPAPQVAITLDGVADSGELVNAGRPTNPGEHRLQASFGVQRREQQVRLAEHDHKLLQLQFERANAAEPVVPVQPTAPRDGASKLYVPLAITAIALGGAGLATAGITALAASGKCSDGNCDTEADKSSYDTLRTISTVSIWTGAVVVAGGVVTWLLAPEEREQQAGLRWGLGPTGASVRGTF
ncbi:MAG: hypothetical protein ABW321_22750 [Polyangiales bacterium]